jgi:hypothetical protein
VRSFESIRSTFVKIAMRVEERKVKIKFAFPASHPNAAMFAAMPVSITVSGP